MRRITALVDHELTWTQPSGLKSQYELRFGNELVATLRFPKTLGSHAVAEAEDGSWRFERVGFWKTKTIIKTGESETEIAAYETNVWKGGGSLIFPNGRKYVMVANIWKSRFEFRTDADETLIEINNSSVLRLSATVRMYRKAVRIPEFPMIVLFGSYLVVMSRRDAAAHTATS
ncbi:MAG: hypothetical protein FJ217_04380 [Ignavibacteria bacterium]|nr:hypothetical protein [Ignavibacteria bacterium]